MFLYGKSFSLRRFWQQTDGDITVESVIVLPILLWLFGAGWVYFDAFHQQGVNQKANYTIADMISRETDPLNGTYVTNTYNLLQLLGNSSGSETDLRVSVVSYDAETTTWSVVWSQARGGRSALTSASAISDRLPAAMNAEQLIVVETWEDHSPVLQVGLGDFEIKTYSFTRPRYTPQILFTG
ncbi:MAG: hypothetical protein N4A61_03105 [Pelagimonas sp.]|jgi:Flp pilus assembly protein TadG|nr:hypothetical protein [Pelagimonas sp.]